MTDLPTITTINTIMSRNKLWTLVRNQIKSILRLNGGGDCEEIEFLYEKYAIVSNFVLL